MGGSFPKVVPLEACGCPRHLASDVVPAGLMPGYGGGSCRQRSVREGSFPCGGELRSMCKGTLYCESWMQALSRMEQWGSSTMMAGGLLSLKAAVVTVYRQVCI